MKRFDYFQIQDFDFRFFLTVDESLKKMNTSTLDLVQFHWWDYDDLNYLDALTHLFELKEKEKIKQIGLTNFDTRRIEIMFENDLHPISNQVQYSILDQRPEIKMTPFCLKNNMSLLCYGTLLGGYLSKYGRPEELKVLNGSLLNNNQGDKLQFELSEKTGGVDTATIKGSFKQVLTSMNVTEIRMEGVRFDNPNSKGEPFVFSSEISGPEKRSPILPGSWVDIFTSL